MSRGFGGWCYIAEEDENAVIYQYGAYNLNEPQYTNKEHLSDGIIVIDKSGLAEPEIHKKIKRFPNGKKKMVIKRIVVDVPYADLYSSGKIQIQNCSNCWKTVTNNKDFIAWHLIWKIFRKYQEEGCLPEKEYFDV